MSELQEALLEVSLLEYDIKRLETAVKRMIEATSIKDFLEAQKELKILIGG